MRAFLTNYQLLYRLIFAEIWHCDQAPDCFLKIKKSKITLFNYIVDSDMQISHPYLRHFAVYISNSTSQFMHLMNVKVF